MGIQFWLFFFSFAFFLCISSFSELSTYCLFGKIHLYKIGDRTGVMFFAQTCFFSCSSVQLLEWASTLAYKWETRIHLWVFLVSSLFPGHHFITWPSPDPSVFLPPWPDLLWVFIISFPGQLKTSPSIFLFPVVAHSIASSHIYFPKSQIWLCFPLLANFCWFLSFTK